jgi:hypothetical protein
MWRPASSEAEMKGDNKIKVCRNRWHDRQRRVEWSLVDGIRARTVTVSWMRPMRWTVEHFVSGRGVMMESTTVFAIIMIPLVLCMARLEAPGRAEPSPTEPGQAGPMRRAHGGSRPGFNILTPAWAGAPQLRPTISHWSRLVTCDLALCFSLPRRTAAALS